MPSYSSSSALGSSVETGEITDGAVTTIKLADNAVTGVKLGTGFLKMVLLETMTASGSSIETTASLDTYPNYFIQADLTTSGNATIRLRVNGVATGYAYVYISNVTVTAASSQTSLMVGACSSAYVNPYNVFIGGKVGSSASQVNVWNSGLRTNEIGLLGTWSGTSGQVVDTLSILPSTGTMDGTIKVYGVSP